jgi:hypothetical protein
MNLYKRTVALLVVTLVLGTAGCSKSSNDGEITSRVKTAISKEPGLKETKVSVSTDQKVVHLSGTVKSRAERAMLIAAARRVEGVKAVKTDLVVKTDPVAKPQQKPVVQARAKTTPRAQQRVTPRGAVPKPVAPPEPSRYGN